MLVSRVPGLGVLRIIRRYLKEGRIGRALRDIDELVGGDTKAGIGVGGLHQDLEVIGIPALVDYLDLAVVAESAYRYGRRDAGAFHAYSIDELRRKILTDGWIGRQA